MTTDHDLDTIADPSWEQYFLVNQDKIDQLLAAVDIRPTDHVVESGCPVRYARGRRVRARRRRGTHPPPSHHL